MSLLLKSTLLDAQFGEKGEEVVYSGMITKEGSVYKTWKKRFMELVKNKATGNIHFRYFKDSKSKKQKGELIVRYPRSSQFCHFKQETDKSYFKILIREPSKLKRSNSDEHLVSASLKVTSFRYRASVLQQENASTSSPIEESSPISEGPQTEVEEYDDEYDTSSSASTPVKTVTSSAPCSASTSPSVQLDRIFDQAMAKQQCSTVREFLFCVEKSKTEFWKEALLSTGMDLLSN